MTDYIRIRKANCRVWTALPQAASTLEVPSSVHMAVSTLRKLRFDRPQKIAALLLLMFFVQGMWVVQRQALTVRDYEFARCGREIWERPSPLAGYFTTCGNLHDGTLGYRLAGLPLTIERILAGQPAETSTWEGRHELGFVRLLLRLPFLFVGVFLGGALWWVTRRLYGNEGGSVALALYCFSPEILRACLYPNNEILAAFGLYAATYTAIGVAHAMQGPRRKWRPRIVLLTVILGFTAAAHISAAIIAFLLAFTFMMYLAEHRRSYVLPILLMVAVGATAMLFASYTFNLDAFSYLFRGGGALLSVSLGGPKQFFSALPNAGITLAASVALLLYAGVRRSRYFGNTTPLIVALLLLPLVTAGRTAAIQTQPWLWALPFLLTFVGGVFADALETPQRRIFLLGTASILFCQAALSLANLPALAR